MKRSEMIQLMTDHWLGLFPNETTSAPGLYDEVFRNMEKLLTAMEYKGMLPPTIYRIDITDLSAITGTATPVNEWKPE